MNNILSKEDIAKIDESIKAFEKKSSAEIVCLIQNNSSDYPQSTNRAALFINLFLHTGLLYFEWWQSGMHMLLSVGFLLIVLPKFLAKLDGLKKIFILKEEAKAQVREAAYANFFKHGLHSTQEKNGVLLYVSKYEREIYLVADEGIFKLHSQDEWDALNAKLGQAIKSQKAREGIIHFIEEIEEISVEHFPVRDINPDELKNIIVVEN